MPHSSASSRARHASGLSPTSILPPGSAQKPARRSPGGRRASSTQAPSRTMTAAVTLMVGAPLLTGSGYPAEATDGRRGRATRSSPTPPSVTGHRLKDEPHARDVGRSQPARVLGISTELRRGRQADVRLGCPHRSCEGNREKGDSELVRIHSRPWNAMRHDLGGVA